MSRLTPGQPLSGNLRASEFNRHVDVSEWYRRNKERGEGDGPLRIIRSTNEVQVRNGAATDLAAGSVLGFNGFLLDDSEVEQRNFYLAGTIPSDGTLGWCITLEPLPDNKIGPGQVAGACMALVNVTDASHANARLKAGETVLQSCSSGPVRILYKPSGTGEKKCAVLLGQETARPGYLIEGLSAGGTANAIELVRNGLEWDQGDGFEVTDFILNSTETAEANTKFLAMPAGGLWLPILYCVVSDNLPDEESS